MYIPRSPTTTQNLDSSPFLRVSSCNQWISIKKFLFLVPQPNTTPVVLATLAKPPTFPVSTMPKLTVEFVVFSKCSKPILASTIVATVPFVGIVPVIGLPPLPTKWPLLSILPTLAAWLMAFSFPLVLSPTLIQP